MIEMISAPVRRLAAIGLVLVAVFAVLTLIVEPALRRMSHVEEQIAGRRELRGRLALLESTAPAVQAQQLRISRVLASEAFLPGETEAIQMANLQSIVRGLAEREGVRVQSSRTLAASEHNGLQQIALQVALQSGMEATQRLLHRIETHRPILRIDGLGIAPASAVAARGGPGEEVLQVELRVLAWLRAANKDAAP